MTPLLWTFVTAWSPTGLNLNLKKDKSMIHLTGYIVTK